MDDLRVFRGKVPVAGEDDVAAVGQSPAAGQGLQGLAAHEDGLALRQRDSFSLEGYDPQPFEDKIPVAI